MGKSLEDFSFRLYPSIEAWDELPDGVSILDTHFSVVNANKTMRNWYAQDTFPRGEKCYHLYHRRQKPCPWCPTRTTLLQGKAASGIVPYHNREGKQEGWQKLAVFPIFDDHRDLVGVMEYVQNITPKKVWEERIHHYEMEQEALRSEILLLERLLTETRKNHHEWKKRWNNLAQEVIRPVLALLSLQLEGKPEQEYLKVIEAFLTHLEEEEVQPEKPFDFSLFTPREIEIARLILQGKRSKEIAHELSLSFKAVEFHRYNLREKLGIRHTKASLHSSLLNFFRP